MRNRGAKRGKLPPVERKGANGPCMSLVTRRFETQAPSFALGTLFVAPLLSSEEPPSWADISYNAAIAMANPEHKCSAQCCRVRRSSKYPSPLRLSEGLR